MERLSEELGRGAFGHLGLLVRIVDLVVNVVELLEEER